MQGCFCDFYNFCQKFNKKIKNLLTIRWFFDILVTTWFPGCGAGCQNLNDKSGHLLSFCPNVRRKVLFIVDGPDFERTKCLVWVFTAFGRIYLSLNL